MEGIVLTNRLLWLGIGLGALAVTYLRFRFAHRTEHFIVAIVADQDNCIATFGIFDRLQMHLRDQRTSRVDGEQFAFAGDATNLR